jgi:MarR family 2-MHQ and catechol resistance regulon transcriptional repressor
MVHPETRLTDLGEENGVITDKIADSILEIWRNFRTFSSPIKAGQITLEQSWILRFLYNSGPKQIKDIASQIGTTSSPVTISVKRMERQNLVRRERGTKDERIVTVSLTKHGKDVFESWRRERRKALSNFFEILDEGEKNRLLSLLQKVLTSKRE